MKIKKMFTGHEYLRKWIVYSVSFSLFLMLIWAILIFFINMEGLTISMFDGLRSRGFSEDNIYATQISSTFIIVGLVSFLSGSGEDVLWENTVRYSLVNPKIINFISMASFLIVDLLFASVAFFANLKNSFFIFFLVNMILLFIMTYKMIGAFFARESIKNELIKNFKRESDDRKREKIDELRDRTMALIIKNQYSIVEENLDFLNSVGCINELVYILRFVSKNNANQFWIFINKYNLLENESIRKISRELCMTLISSHKNIELERQILEMLYGDSGMSHFREAIVKYCSNSGLNNIQTEHKTEHLGDFQRFHDHYGEIIDERVKNAINIPFSNYINNESDMLPIGILLTAYTESNIEAFETVLSFMVKLKANYAEIFNDFIENTVLKPIEIEKSDPAYAFSISRIKARIAVDFISERDRELIQNIIVQSKNSILLTENNIRQLSELALTPIRYNQ